MPEKNKVSVYLIKKEYTETYDIVESYHNSKEIPELGVIFYDNSEVNSPKWISSFFCGKLTKDEIFTANARALLLVKIDKIDNGDDRTFAVSMGYGKSILKDNVVEDRFGLKVILNTVNSSEIRRINRINIGGNQKQSNEQIPKDSSILEFGLDIERDLVSYIEGSSSDDSFVKGRLSGGDLLSFSNEIDITNVKDFLKKAFSKYKEESYKIDFGWIDYIQNIKDKNLKSLLDNELLKIVNSESKEIYLAIPSIIDWHTISGFRYSRHPSSQMFDDISLATLKEVLRSNTLTLKQLQQNIVCAVSSTDNSNLINWKVYNCLYGELDYNQKSYCINGGKWFQIDNNYEKTVNEYYSSANISDIEFRDFTPDLNTEEEYNRKFCEENQSEYLLLDRKLVNYGGGRSKIEICDILSKHKNFIHVKQYSGSATLSHLFNQALVSMESLISDKVLLSRLNREIETLTSNKDFIIEDIHAAKVTIAIINSKNSTLPNIPFFSKVSFKHVKMRLEAFNISVEIKSIKKLIN